LRRFFVGNDKFQLEHGLNGGDDFQKYGVSAVLVLIVIRLAFLTVAKLAAVLFDEGGNLLADAFGYVDVKIVEALSPVRGDGVERLLVGGQTAGKCCG